jgi:hypothetical protein
MSSKRPKEFHYKITGVDVIQVDSSKILKSKECMDQLEALQLLKDSDIIHSFIHSNSKKRG